jgi:hypothetical protein
MPRDALKYIDFGLKSRATAILQTLALPLGDDAREFDFTGLARRVHAYARDAPDRRR